MVAFTVDQSDDSFLDLRAKIYLAHRSHGTEKVADLTISWKVRTRHFGLKDEAIRLSIIESITIYFLLSLLN